MGLSRACASKWVNRWRRHGELGLHDRPSTPHEQPTATPAEVVARIAQLRRAHKWSARRIRLEFAADRIVVWVRTISRHLVMLRVEPRRFLDPDGDTNREPGRIVARYPGHMIHLDVKKVGTIPRRRPMACPRPRVSPSPSSPTARKPPPVVRLRTPWWS